MKKGTHSIWECNKKFKNGLGVNTVNDLPSINC